MEIRIKKLGLAAYIKTMSEEKIANTNFLSYDKEEGFIFDSEKTANDWKVEYMNSLCSRFDKNLMEMREFLK